MISNSRFLSNARAYVTDSILANTAPHHHPSIWHLKVIHFTLYGVPFHLLVSLMVSFCVTIAFFSEFSGSRLPLCHWHGKVRTHKLQMSCDIKNDWMMIKVKFSHSTSCRSRSYGESKKQQSEMVKKVLPNKVNYGLCMHCAYNTLRAVLIGHDEWDGKGHIVDGNKWKMYRPLSHWSSLMAFRMNWERESGSMGRSANGKIIYFRRIGYDLFHLFRSARTNVLKN